jgi:small conductance mechanosensitive channel
VKNLTRSWSRANFSVDVAYQTDPVKAINVLRKVGDDLYEDPEWHEKILATPEVLGIDNLSHGGMTITIWIQTAPAQQWSVGRELRFRVRQALEKNRIEIGVPRQIFSLDSSGSSPLNPSFDL